MIDSSAVLQVQFTEYFHLFWFSIPVVPQKLVSYIEIDDINKFDIIYIYIYKSQVDHPRASVSMVGVLWSVGGACGVSSNGHIYIYIYIY